jgi:hypothetical protein
MQKEEILARCLDEIRSGRSTLEECVARHPECGDELRSLLEMALSIKADQVTPSFEFKQRARRRLFEEMQTAPQKYGRTSWLWPRLAGLRVLAVAVIGLSVAGVAGGGTVLAAQGSLPGDGLYGVKTGFENVQLALAPGDEAKAKLRLDIAQKRVDEATREVELKKEVDGPALQTVQSQYDQAIQELSHSDDPHKAGQVLQQFTAKTLNQQLEIEQALPGASSSSQKSLNQALDVTRRGNLISQSAQNNPEFLQHQPSVSDQKLDSGQFKIEGTLVSINGSNWSVGGVVLKNVQLKAKPPSIGAYVRLEGVVKDGQAFINRIGVDSVSANAPTKVEGQVGQTNQNGTTEVGGIPLNIGDSSGAPLNPGDHVQLQAGPPNDKLKVTAQQSKNNQSASNTTIAGTLSAVDTAKGTLTVKMSGNLITVNVNQAAIKTENNRPLKLSDLKSRLGQDIKLEGLSKKGNLISAGSALISANN